MKNICIWDSTRNSSELFISLLMQNQEVVSINVLEAVRNLKLYDVLLSALAI